MAITSAAAKISKAIIGVALPPGLARSSAIACSMTSRQRRSAAALARHVRARLQRICVRSMGGETMTTRFVGRDLTKRK